MTKLIRLNKFKIIVGLLFFSLLGTGIFIYNNLWVFFIDFPPFISKQVNDMDYILVTDSSEIIKINVVKTSEPGIMKSPIDATLYYTDGHNVQIKLYGNYFGIVGEDYTVFGKENLYHFNYRNE